MHRACQLRLVGIAALGLAAGALGVLRCTRPEAAAATEASQGRAAYAVGMGQVWDVSLIPELRKRGFNGNLIHFYAPMTPAELGRYMTVAAEHGFEVMPSVRAEYISDEGRRLAALAAVARRFQNLWAWHCEGQYVNDKKQMELIREIVGQDFVVKFDNQVRVDESVARRYSRLWYPKLRSDPDKKESPEWGRWRPEIYSSFPLYQLQNRVSPPNTFEVWLQAYGLHRPNAAFPGHANYYIPPNAEDMIYWALAARQAGAKAIWWYTLSSFDDRGRHVPLWESRPEIWKGLCQATDFVLTGKVPLIRTTNRYLVLENPPRR